VRVGDRIVAQVTQVHENRIVLESEGRLGQVNVCDLTWDERAGPGLRCDAFAVAGESLDVVVLAVDGLRFSASIKHLVPDPWGNPSLAAGTRVQGCVRAVHDWGAFVGLDNAIVARLDDDSPVHAVGSRGTFEISSVDRAARRLRARWVAALSQ